MKTKEWALSALSSLIRGENLQSKRDFIDIDGLEFILKILDNNNIFSDKMRNKALNMLNDIVYVILFDINYNVLKRNE